MGQPGSNPGSGISVLPASAMERRAAGLHPDSNPATGRPFRLADIAPRLALARDQYLAERAEIARRERARATARLRLERLIAHRELQLIRAGARGSRRYLEVRQRKLDSARRALGRLEAS